MNYEAHEPNLPSGASEVMVEAWERQVRARNYDDGPIVGDEHLEHLGATLGLSEDQICEAYVVAKTSVEEQAKMNEILSPEEIAKQYPHTTTADLSQPGPWDMPSGIWWNLREGSTIRRAQWVIDKHPEVSIDELTRFMALQPEHIKQLQVENREE